MMNEDKKATRGRPRTMSEDAVLDVAISAYQSSDPADVSVNAICQMAGIAKPSLYRAFSNEDGLTLAALDRYADNVLADIFAILQSNQALVPTLAALVDFAVDDQRLETGCLFYKMRAGKHRLGPRTRARIDEIDAAAVRGFEAYLRGQQKAGCWDSDQPTSLIARYLIEQIGLALAQRATQHDKAEIRRSLALAFSAVKNT
jgi:AcrR family transcriptional regulator